MNTESAPPADTAQSSNPSNDTAQNTANQNPNGGTPPADNTNQQTPPQDNATPPNGEGGSEFVIPEAYQKKPIEGQEGKFENAWTDKIKSEEDLWKLAANSQKMLGKKNLTPDFETATPQEIEQYFNEIRPQDKNEYNFKTSEDYTETGLEESFATMLHEVGLSKYQGDKLIAMYQQFEQQKAQELYDADSFIAGMEEVFGKGFEVKTDQTRQLIEANLNDKQKERLENVPNEYLTLMYELAHNLDKAYGASESGLGGENPPGFVPKKNIDEQITGVRKQLEEISKRPHDANEKQVLVDQLLDLTKQKKGLK